MSVSALYDGIKNSGIMFNVEPVQVFTANGLAIPNKRAILNTATNEVVGLVSDSYKIVTNEEVYSSLLTSIEKARLDTTDATVAVKSSHGGARTLVDIILPAYSIMSGTNETKMRISTLNSYDGSWRYTSKAGGIRMACLNGQIIGRSVGVYSQFHNQALDVAKGSEHIVKMIAAFAESEDFFNEMIARKITADEVISAIGRFVGVVDHKNKLTEQEALKVSEHRNGKKLLTAYEAYATEMGQNAYALYNAFTDFITHKKRNDSTAATSLIYDEDKLAQLVDARVFN